MEADSTACFRSSAAAKSLARREFFMAVDHEDGDTFQLEQAAAGIYLRVQSKRAARSVEQVGATRRVGPRVDSLNLIARRLQLRWIVAETFLRRSREARGCRNCRSRKSSMSAIRRRSVELGVRIVVTRCRLW